MGITATRNRTYTSVNEEMLGTDPLPFLDPATDARMARARFNPVNWWSPRPEFTRRTLQPTSRALQAFRDAWWARVCTSSSTEYPELVAHEFAATDSPHVWGTDATADEIRHARIVAGRFASVLSGGTLRCV